MKKAVVPILVIILLLFAFTNPTSSADSVKQTILTQEQVETVSAGLARFAERNKDIYPLPEIDFSEWSVGQAVQAYEYLDTGFSAIERFYPLFCDGQLAAFAIDTDDGKFQITKGFADTIVSEHITALALVYDLDSAYLYDGEKFLLVSENCMEVAGRATLPDLHFTRTAEIKITNLSPSQSLAS